MKAKDNSHVIEFTRGSEIWIHQFRMFVASVLNVILFGLVATLFIVGLYLYLKVDQNQINAATLQYNIWLQGLMNSKDSIINVVVKGTSYDLTLTQAQRYIDPQIVLLKKHLLRAFLLGIVTSTVGVIALVYYWFTYGKQVMSDEQIRGAELVSNQELVNRIKNNGGFSPYRIAGIPLKKNSEGINIGVIGSPGSGKSQVFRSQIEQVRKHKKKAIIYDPSGEFTQEFYRPGVDIILNPFDERMPLWTPYLEIEHDEHFDSTAHAFIPVQSKETFFEDAARVVMSEVMRELYAQNQVSNKELYDTISKMTLKELSSLLEGTAATKYVDPKNEKTVNGVLMTVQNKLRAFRYLPDSGTAFSIRKWVKNADEDSIVFLSLRDEQKTTIEPLIVLWFTIFIKAVMNLKPIHKERLWLFLDEIPTLPRMDIMPISLTNTRKYGLCHMLGFQDLPLLDHVYGEKTAQSMVSSLQTKLFMRVNENNTAKRMSEILGQMEVAEKSMSRSMGVNDSRDGDSVIMQRRERFIVMPSEIMKLPDLIGYLRIPGDFPVTKVKQKYTPHAENQEPFIERNTTSIITSHYANSNSSDDSDPQNKAHDFMNDDTNNNSFNENSKKEENPVSSKQDQDFDPFEHVNQEEELEIQDENFNTTQIADPQIENSESYNKITESSKMKDRLSTFANYIDEDKEQESTTTNVSSNNDISTEELEDKDKRSSLNAKMLNDYIDNN